MKLVVREMLVTVLNGSLFLGQALKANGMKRSWVNIVYFVCPSQNRKSCAGKKTACMFYFSRTKQARSLIVIC